MENQILLTIVLGNSIFFNDQKVIDWVKKDSLKKLINDVKCSPPHSQLIKEIQKFIN